MPILFLIYTLCSYAFGQNLQPIFSQEFPKYIDGPSKGKDHQLYFVGGNKVFKYENEKVTVFYQFEKLGSLNTTALSSLEMDARGHFYFSDYKNNIVWKLPFKDGAYQTKKITRFIENKKMKQPNDLSFSTDHLVAADHKKEDRPAGLWLYPKNARSQSKFIITKGTLSGLTTDANEVYISSGSPCFIAKYNIENKPKLIWQKPCSTLWSVDGIDFLNSKLYVTRIELGRIDVLNPKNGQLTEGYCLLRKKNYGKIKEKYGINDTPKSCQPEATYELGKNPTDIQFINTNTAMISFMGNASKGGKEERGYIDFLKISEP